MQLPNDIQTVFKTSTCLHTRTAVEAALDNMAAEMNQRLAATNPIFVCILVGGIIPLGNLLPRLDFPLEVDYAHATRYQGKTRGSDLKWQAKPQKDLKGRTVIVVDDILDTGLTLQAVIDYCWQQGAQNVYSAVLVDKSEAREPGGLATADFVGLKVENLYVFGYGLDYKEYLRNARGIYAVAPEYE
ncbi:MAG TPA: hypoxanthine-guanine phosphoribosyltransferase [Gammaproteobacteria bacterium]|nr:hypoxanthine-guanine phosphoribosyltransferase [Gammaproteobacteria bacterium]